MTEEIENSVTTYIYAVTNFKRKRIVLQNIAEMLAIVTPPGDKYKVVKTASGYDIYQAVDDYNFVLIKKYLVIVIQASFNIEPLRGFGRGAIFYCNDVIKELECMIEKLKNVDKIISERGHNEAFEGLDRVVFDLSGEY